MRHYTAILLGKLTFIITQFLHLGAGGTWPGEITLTIDPQILKRFSSQFRKGIIIVAGTNGKTTTSLMISHLLQSQNYTIVHNNSGANLLNGIASALVKACDWKGKIQADWGVFEVDENSLSSVIFNIKIPILSSQVKDKKLIIVLLNLFRDQLDRYGEVDVIAEKWKNVLQAISHQSSAMRDKSDITLILNADDPQVAYLGQTTNAKNYYFGISDPQHFLRVKEHATDSTFCLHCGARLVYTGIYFSHLGIWNCAKCGLKRPLPMLTDWNSPLPGLYNKYNTLASVSVARNLHISDEQIGNTLIQFKPAFGRQEEFDVKNKKIKLFLSKNPSGFNASLRTVLELKSSVILIILNDRIPDGRDVSWIWDVDFETIPNEVKVIVSGERVFDLGIRLKYAFDLKNSDASRLIIEPNLNIALKKGLSLTKENETLYVLPTYSAMLEVRKIITGKKIL